MWAADAVFWDFWRLGIVEVVEEPLSSVEETIAEPEPEINAVRVPDRRFKIKKIN